MLHIHFHLYPATYVGYPGDVNAALSKIGKFLSSILFLILLSLFPHSQTTLPIFPSQIQTRTPNVAILWRTSNVHWFCMTGAGRRLSHTIVSLIRTRTVLSNCQYSVGSITLKLYFNYKIQITL